MGPLCKTTLNVAIYLYGCEIKSLTLREVHKLHRRNQKHILT
jgi:hypothetical protein